MAVDVLLQMQIKLLPSQQSRKKLLVHFMVIALHASYMICIAM
jgi:hypothetical protein